MVTCDLYTKAGEALGETAWTDYPRPQMVRDEWMTLNGMWDFFDGDGEKKRIRVPFCPESLLSGVHKTYPNGARLRYERAFTVPEAWNDRRVLLRFGAVDQLCEVSVNGKNVCSHEGGYLAFSCDITEALRPGENTVSVSVTDELSHRLPWGKQKNDRGGMWYTPVSGIWQSVWLEPVPEQHVERLCIRSDLTGTDIIAEGVREGTVLFAGREVPLTEGHARVEVDDPVLWTPENPKLYPFEIVSGEDRVQSYFALRTVSVSTVNGKARFLLNGKPYFFHGLLDQGYWSDGLYTPPTEEGFADDIRAMKELGFNTLRKHIKIEPERFYFECDRLGMVVWQDMVNAGEYSFLRDTVLPTAGIQHLSDRKLNRDGETRRAFLDAMRATVRQLEAHPSIVLWTVFNEGWGQFCADDAYAELKKLDPTRLIDTTSGWFRQKKSDVESLHIYFKPLRAAKGARPVVISEYGGYAWKLSDHCFNPDHTYGYRKFSDRESFAAAVKKLLREELLPLVRKCVSAAIYTQVSDVEDETNGLLTCDRRVCKLDAAELRPIAEELQKAVKEE